MPPFTSLSPVKNVGFLGSVVAQVGSQIREVAQQTLGIETATVRSDLLLSAETVVSFDSDPSQTPVVARSICGVLEEGVRVYVLKYPPNGLLVIGRADDMSRFARIRAQLTNDVSLTSTRHPFQIGPDLGTHLAMDNNEIQGRVYNPATPGTWDPANIAIQQEGGNVGMFANSTAQDTLNLNDGGLVSSPMAHKWDAEGTNQAIYNSATGTLGAPTNGFTFVAPPSGAGSFSCGAFGTVAVAGVVGKFWAELREGSTIGSGTLVVTGDNDNGPSIRVQAESASVRFYQGGNLRMVTGLTPGNTYNISGWYAVEVAGGGAAGITLFARQLTWIPSP